MGKRVFYKDDARARLLGGAEILYEAVKTTMGPKGQNVVINKPYGPPTITHDGVTVARGVVIDDVDDDTLGYRIGAELIKEAAAKMDKVGDGTTTVTVLTYHILKAANRMIVAGHSPMDLRRGLETALEWTVAQLDNIAEKIDGDPLKIAYVASISAGDEDLGQLIASVFSEIGKDGAVTVETGNGLETKSSTVDGYTIDTGYISPYMVTDQKKQEGVYEGVPVLLCNDKITNVQEILPIIQALADSGKKDLIIFADDFDTDVINNFVINRVRGMFNVTAIKAPGFADKKRELLGDIAVVLGGKVIAAKEGTTLDKVDVSMLGSADRVVVARNETTIVNGHGDQKHIAARIDELKTRVDNASTDFEKAMLSKRIAALSGKVAVIEVGGGSDTEIEEKKYRVDDAVAAVKAAMSEGIVPGGGVALFNIATAADSNNPGFNLLLDAMEQPIHIILENAGLPAEHLVEQIRAYTKPGYGINVTDVEPGIVDMKKAGVIDPVVVTKEAVRNAVSIAGTAMTMGALIVDVPSSTIDKSN